MSIKKVFRVVAVIMCTIIGAGFASGKEIYIFFARFGEYGKIGILLSGIITGSIVYSCFKIANKNNIENNSKFMKEINAPHILYNIVNVFLLISFYIMISGFAGFFKQELGVSVYITSGILSVLLYFVLIKKIDGIVKLNTIIAPVLILVLIYIGVKYGIKKEHVAIIKQDFFSAIFNSILYASYNSIVLIPILVSLRKYIDSKKIDIQVSVFTTIIAILVTLGICGVLQKNNVDINKNDLPIIRIIDNRVEKYIYSATIEVAIFTSAISAGYGVLENLSENTKINRKKYKTIVAFMCLIGIPISEIGFGRLVNTMYPLFGALNIIQIGLILKKLRA